MAEIQMTYREGYCALEDIDYSVRDYYSAQCHMDCAGDAGCPRYDNGRKDIPFYVPYGDCMNAMFATKYKGVSVKNYEIEEYEDNYNLHLSCALVKIGKRTYECEKVILDGVCVYPKQDED